MDYDYSKLIGAIAEVFGSRLAFAKAMGMGETTLSFKLNNKSEWTQEEMRKAMKLLNRPEDTIGDYFFTHKV